MNQGLAAARAEPEPRSAYRHFEPAPTHWMDDDVLDNHICGHVNNVVDYGLFDSTVNRDLYAANAPLGAARGHFMHVYVDREHRRPAVLPGGLLQAVKALPC